ncbi:glutamate--cysteine ligase%2C Gcs2 [Mycobacterium tuberculosis]|uniref:Glutamate--cysteine ligase, Gcs2 n=1 Tax=Mycobacterium tuberculosis TaxID=1773 RepID=A0A655APR1_MYCTX|nr:glutamate--cysteine ligase%2C Gcs2 [Mycobacterium tuberculosis]CKT44219.1 glutamate--cysteine ligase%2C Gcs2 [Mycobacterium tuberculosis]
MRRVSLPNQLNETRRRSPTRGERIFGGYNTSDVYAMAFDEMFDAQGIVRGPYKGIYAELAPSDASELKARADALGRAFIDQGITFSLSGQERPFPLDLVPRVISAPEWTRLERGITQRVKALECYLDDIYGDQEILRDGVIPRRLVTSCEHFHRQAVGIVPPNGVRIHVAGIDLIRDHRGDFRVLEDNLRSPSGVSYVMENRRTMARVFPNLFATHRVRAVDDYASHLLRAAQLGGHQRGRPHGRGSDPWGLQLGVFRAFIAGPADGCRIGRGPRPVLSRQPGIHAHHRGGAPGRRHLSAH